MRICIWNRKIASTHIQKLNTAKLRIYNQKELRHKPRWKTFKLHMRSHKTMEVRLLNKLNVPHKQEENYVPNRIPSKHFSYFQTESIQIQRRVLCNQERYTWSCPHNKQRRLCVNEERVVKKYKTNNYPTIFVHDLTEFG